MFVHITEDDRGQPFEVFVTLGKAGGSAMADAEAVGRLISLALRSGIPLPEIERQLRGISSDRAVGLGPNKILSMPDAIGVSLADWSRDRQGVQQELLDSQAARPSSAATREQVSARSGPSGEKTQTESRDSSSETFMGTCPDCGSQLEYAEGCVKCHVCGFSECG
jgi:ribonucleoside-diphosphate reductase alpha chain